MSPFLQAAVEAACLRAQHPVSCGTGLYVGAGGKPTQCASHTPTHQSPSLFPRTLPTILQHKQHLQRFAYFFFFCPSILLLEFLVHVLCNFPLSSITRPLQIILFVWHNQLWQFRRSVIASSAGMIKVEVTGQLYSWAEVTSSPRERAEEGVPTY